jgi:hypothetical protein
VGFSRWTGLSLMALRYTDGFDCYASGTDLTKKWATTDATWIWSPTAGRFGGGAISNTGGGGGGKILHSKNGIVSNVQDTAFGFYFKASGLPAANSTIFQTFSVGAANWFSIQITTTGLLLVLAPAGNITSTINVCDGNWHWIEVRMTNNTTSYLYIDNLSQGTGGYAGNLVDNLSLFSVSGITVYFDDIIAYDGFPPTDGAGHNFPLGARQITTTRPTSDGTIGFTTTSSGSTHFNLVNEVNPDGDTSYVQDAVVGDQDLLNFGALGYTPAVINGVMVNTYINNPVGGTINLQAICKSGAAAQSNATAQATPLIYTTMQYPFPVDPNTSAAWLTTALNAAQFGYKNA